MSEPDHLYLRPIPNLMNGDKPAAFPFFYICARPGPCVRLRSWSDCEIVKEVWFFRLRTENDADLLARAGVSGARRRHASARLALDSRA